MGVFDRDNEAEAKEAIKRGDVSGAMEAAEREAATRALKESLSADRKAGGLDSFKK